MIHMNTKHICMPSHLEISENRRLGECFSNKRHQMKALSKPGFNT